ncbi:MAG: vitamin K epoxide reductase family protein [Planctomycetota bacterium]
MFGRRTILALLITVLALVALGIAGYLTWVAWQSGKVAGCTAESLLDCDDVLTSRWSKWLGMPVSLLGMATYAAILGLVWPAASRPNGAAVTALFAAGALATGAAAWFIGLQAIQLQSFCAYCLTAHGCALVIGVLATLMFLDTRDVRDYDQMRSLLGVAASEATEEAVEVAEPLSVTRLITALTASAIGLAALMGGQLLVDPGEAMALEEIEFEPAAEVAQITEPTATADEVDVDLQVIDDGNVPGESGEWVEDDLDVSVPATSEGPDTIGSIFGNGSGRVVYQALPEGVDVNDMPVLGNPNAPHILLEMMDYTCDHCRKLHPHLQAAVERYGDQIGVVIYNVPLSKKCNAKVKKDYPGKKYACDYAQLAIGVWKLAPEQYPEFHHWLLESEKAPSVTKAKRRARSIAGNEVLIDKDVRADTSRRLASQCSKFGRLNSGLPILLLPNGALRGVPDESEELFEYLEGKLDIQPQ